MVYYIQQVVKSGRKWVFISERSEKTRFLSISEETRFCFSRFLIPKESRFCQRQVLIN